MRKLITSIGTKIAAGFLALFMVFLFIMGLSYYQIKSVEYLVATSVMEKADARNLSNNIVMESFQTLNFVDEFIKTGDNRRKIALRIIINDEVRTIQEYMNQIANRNLTQAEKEKFGAIHTAFSIYLENLQKVLRNSGSTFPAARESKDIENGFLDSHSYLITKLLQLSYLESSLMYESWEYSKKKIDLIKMYALAFSVSAFVLSLVLGFIITRTITSPISSLVRVLEKFGAGNFKIRADVRSRDEIGFMAEKFNVMCDDLEKTNQQLMDIIDFQPDATLVIDTDHKVIAWNHAMERMSGVSKAEILGKGDFVYALPFYGQARPVVVDMVIDGSADVSEEYQLFKKQGNLTSAEIFVPRLYGGKGCYLSILASPLFDANGNLIGAIESLRDISERKAAEEAIRKSEEYARTLFNSVNDAIFVQDTSTGAIYDVNDKMCEMYGYTRKEACNATIASLSAGVPPYTDDDAMVWVRKAVAGEPQLFEWHARDSFGRLFWCEVNMREATLGDKKRLLVVVRDISERKKAEEALNEEKERLSVTLRSIGEGVIAADVNQIVVIINKIAEKMTGWSQEEAVGRPLKEVFSVIDHKTGKTCGDETGYGLNYGNLESHRKNTALLGRDGSEKLIDCSIAPIFDRESRAIGTIIVFQDITEKEKTEAELLKTQKLESLGIFAGGIAHDFNNILMGILGSISLLKIKEKEDPFLTSKLGDIENATLRAKDLTHQLLTFAKGGNPVKKTVSVGRLLKESAGFVLSGANVKCEFNIADGLPPSDIDDGQISQVVNNLLINANQAMPGGGIINISLEQVSVGRNIPSLKPGPYVKISIKDHGEGIPPENLSKIFDPFFTTKPKGNGLGLSTAYSIIQKHNGYLAVESECGAGTTFYIFLPASEKELAGETKGTEILVGSKKRILLMDDDKMILNVGTEMLEHLGFDVECAQDGRETINLFGKARDAGSPFDIVIMDLTIPAGMGGRETVAELIKLDPDVKAVVSSGYSNDPVIASFGKYGFKGAIIKPYKIEDLSIVLQPLL